MRSRSVFKFGLSYRGVFRTAKIALLLALLIVPLQAKQNAFADSCKNTSDNNCFFIVVQTEPQAGTNNAVIGFDDRFGLTANENGEISIIYDFDPFYRDPNKGIVREDPTNYLNTLDDQEQIAQIQESKSYGLTITETTNNSSTEPTSYAKDLINENEIPLYISITDNRGYILGTHKIDNYNEPERTMKVQVERDENGEIAKVSYTDPTGFGTDYTIEEIIPEGTLSETVGKNYELQNGSSESSNDSEDAESENSEPTCESSGAADTLGWLICPTLQWFSDSAVRIYDDYVAPSLQVEPQLFQAAPQNSEKSTTEAAWEIFRNFANVFFIILLLVVIFSQLTGVGIDNYGIKKILPKAIVTAIFVNLSFIICLVCVDLSNIVGHGLQSLFDGMTESFTVTNNVTLVNDVTGARESVEVNPSTSNASKGGATIYPVVILVAIFGAIATIANPAVLLTLFIGAIGVLISILFLFVILAARKAIIVLLTLISPLAFVCFILPNTKRFYKTWLKTWSTMLLLYPICGILIGGGNFASKLLLAIGIEEKSGFFGAFTAMMVGVIPIFFIPTLLRGSLSSLGKIGSTISGFGQRASGAATSRMTRSRFNQNMQARGAERSERLRQARKAGGYMGKDGKWHSNDFGIRRRLANTRAGRLFGLDYGVGKATNQYLNARTSRDEYADYSKQSALDDIMRREQSRKKSKAFKNYSDQYAGYSKQQLQEEAAGVGDWGNDEDSSEKLSALISAMEGNKLDTDIFQMLRENPGLKNNSRLMTALSQSNNSLLRAYGETNLDIMARNEGEGISYDSFMGETFTDTDGVARTHAQKYIESKSSDFTKGINASALKELADYEEGVAEGTAFAGHQNISTSLVDSIDSKGLPQEAVAEVNRMSKNRNDHSFSLDDLLQYDPSHIESIAETEQGRNLIVDHADQLSKNKVALSKLKPRSKDVINQSIRNWNNANFERDRNDPSHRGTWRRRFELR